MRSDQNNHAADQPAGADERHRDARLQQVFLEVLEHGRAEDGGGEERDDHVDGEPTGLRRGRQADQNIPELPPIHRHDR
jgi:hypothetical protein